MRCLRRQVMRHYLSSLNINANKIIRISFLQRHFSAILPQLLITINYFSCIIARKNRYRCLLLKFIIKFYMILSSSVIFIKSDKIRLDWTILTNRMITVFLFRRVLEQVKIVMSPVSLLQRYRTRSMAIRGYVDNGMVYIIEELTSRSSSAFIFLQNKNASQNRETLLLTAA